MSDAPEHDLRQVNPDGTALLLPARWFILGFGGAPESQIRTRLPAGGRWIRTVGPRHERAGFCCGRRIAGPNGGSQKGLFLMRFESISLRRRVTVRVLNDVISFVHSLVFEFRFLQWRARRRDSPSHCDRLDCSLHIGTTGSHVPYKSLIRLRAAYMPDAARAASRTTPELVPDARRTPGFDIILGISSRHQRFAPARLFAPYLTGSSPAFCCNAHHPRS